MQNTQQRNATQRNATQLAKLHPKFFFLSFLATSSLLLPTASFANPANSTQNQVSEALQVPQLSAKESYGCEAFLCFAGGLHEPACQKTILQVKRDLIRGHGFPHCPSVANADGYLVVMVHLVFGHKTPKSVCMFMSKMLTALLAKLQT